MCVCVWCVLLSDYICNVGQWPLCMNEVFDFDCVYTTVQNTEIITV